MVERRYLTNKAKEIRDERIRAFAAKHPHWTQKKLAKRYKVTQAYISIILNHKEQEIAE